MKFAFYPFLSESDTQTAKKLNQSLLSKISDERIQNHKSKPTTLIEKNLLMKPYLQKLKLTL